MPGHLETLLAFDHQFQRDQNQSPAFLHRRDRRYALDQGEPRQPDISRWLEQFHAIDQRSASTQEPELIAWRRLSRAFIAAGAILGMLTMSGLLFYDGGQQINITVILGVVLLQLLLALLTAVQGLSGWQPWAPLVHRLQRRLGAPRPTSPLTALAGPLMARTAQAAGLAFATTGLITLLVCVVLQDLAFGWSTTLNTSAEHWHRLVSGVAAPWSDWLPAATPSPELVADTRFFRLDNAGADTDAIRWGDWWPFVAMAWLTWTLLPRLLLLMLACADLRRRSLRALRQHPGYPALLWRLETPAVETGSETGDSGQLPDEAGSETVALPTTSLVVAWAGATAEGVLPAAGITPQRAGGNQSLQADQQALRTLAGRQGTEDRQLLVITRGWEPPTAELEDFLEDASETIPDTTIILLPVATDPTSRLPAQQLAQWLRFADRAGQGIRVATSATEDGSHDNA